ncbi:diphosphomevalonate decarboxylase [Actinomyces sp. oral taxon 170]|uniref:diphosphomevalonate decarboxylase n=1 Tax=Actinomyces sp. oral taxon 170 TaxID=712117 RepID=UPI000205C2AD|nr:diphosphomevalonate decarboxylase [Actinomyces sp. oral taxon 170]EGF50571.1 diphosphomevalonate decarboxylase [Actinomyces sp. oral taxon 170 str. F0386]
MTSRQSPASLKTASATASANTNIALIKYWGKADESLMIPTTSSLSLTLDDTWTTTTVSFDGGTGDTDAVSINGSAPSGTALTRVSGFLDLVRERSGITQRANVTSISTVPLAAGLASSAAGFAALAAAASRAAGMDLDGRALSRLARRGSGSAARSVFGGLVLWNAGDDDATSYAEPVQDAIGHTASDLDLAMVVVVLSGGRKTISSTRAMRRTMTASPLYPAWVEASRQDLRDALEAVRCGDLARLGKVAEANALGMHASMMAARPAIMYWLPRTIEVLHVIGEMRQDGLPAWATIDAGPNVKVLTRGGSAERVAAALRERVPGAEVSVRRPGAGVRFEEASR